MGKVDYRKVILREKEELLKRRKLLNIEHGKPDNDHWFGIALSGGGIRSATINLGFLKTLHRFGILKKADYLSSVSGGGYTHSYIQGTTREAGSLDGLFSEGHIKAMREHGKYLTPGKGIWKIGSMLLLLVAVAISWFMTILSPLIVVGILYYAYGIIARLLGSNPLAGTAAFAEQGILWAMYGIAGVFVVHLIVNIYLSFNLGVSKFFNRIETAFATIGVLLFGLYEIANISGQYAYHGGMLDSALRLVTLFVLGYYLNPNAISLHRFYRKQLSELFLRFSGRSKNIRLKDLFSTADADASRCQAPYPIINTCLNLQSPDGDEKFKGVKANDYFLLSPFYCGSKLTGYQNTDYFDDLRNLTLPAAITISAAAVNPGMGMYSSKTLSVLMTLFNARMGLWVSNPLMMKKPYALIWWPIYFFRELLGRISSRSRMVNISDGGHIENFGAYELLRRGCRLIISVDAGEDRAYQFSDLNNFILRARNELGLEIRFREGQQPEDVIRPKPSQVYSQQRYAVADIYQWWADDKIVDDKTQPVRDEVENFVKPVKVGTFVYVKSSVTAPVGKPDLDKRDELKYGTYKYKIYHPEFPHESTSDQFFDPIQWEAYYQLGQFIGAEILGLSSPDAYKQLQQAVEEGTDVAVPDPPQLKVEDLIGWFDDPNKNPLPLHAALAQTKRTAVEEGVLESTREEAKPEGQYTM
ncbi:MAG: hypothetical protein EP344_16345 [Bacteroidetes bacterium]|nr:MAG: hypothetical protein EP344_16345 [Bacteroidota bacterium]